MPLDRDATDIDFSAGVLNPDAVEKPIFRERAIDKK
jgi:hypothetical protein